MIRVKQDQFLDPRWRLSNLYWITDKAGKAVTVDVKAVAPVKTPVTLAAIKADPKLADFGLVRQSRLSVVPVSAEQWKLIEKMAK